MPQLDGIGAIARIKAAQPAVQIVALTSFIEEDKVLAALEAGRQRLHPQGRRGGRRRGRDPGGLQRRGPPRSCRRPDPREGHADAVDSSRSTR